MRSSDLDIRVIERRLKDGGLNREEYETYLNSLPDVSDKGCPLTLNGDVVCEPELNAKSENQEEDK